MAVLELVVPVELVELAVVVVVPVVAVIVVELPAVLSVVLLVVLAVARICGGTFRAGGLGVRVTCVFGLRFALGFGLRLGLACLVLLRFEILRVVVFGLRGADCVLVCVLRFGCLPGGFVLHGVFVRLLFGASAALARVVRCVYTRNRFGEVAQFFIIYRCVKVNAVGKELRFVLNFFLSRHVSFLWGCWVKKLVFVEKWGRE